VVKVLTLNTRGIKEEEKQINLDLCAKGQGANILLFQESNLSDISVLPNLSLYNSTQTQQYKLGQVQQLLYAQSYFLV
jgi:hypothetical protein